MTKECGKKRKLSNVVFIIWGTKGITTIIFIFALLFFLFSLHKQNLFFIPYEQFSFYAVSATAFCILIYLGYLKIKHDNHFYILTDSELIIRSGILNSERIIIPYIQIECVNASQSIIQRIFRVGTLIIETAGGVSGKAEGIIPHISNHKEVISEILEKIEIAKREINV